jgi:pyruvate formate lyase activating enzyme
MSQFDFTFNLAKRLKESGIHICLDTTGFAPEEQFRQILPYIDLYLYDIKHMDTVMHRKLTSVGNELILNNARFLAENGGALQIRFRLYLSLPTVIKICWPPPNFAPRLMSILRLPAR